MAYYNKKLGSSMLGQMTGQLDKDIASGRLKPANSTQKTTTLRGETAKGKSLSALGRTAEDWRQRKTAKSTDEMTEEQLKKPFKADTLNMMYHQTVKKAHSWGSKDPLEDAYQLTCQYRDNVKASYAAGAKDPMAAAQKRYNQSLKELERKTGVQGKSYEELMDKLHSMGGYLTDKEWAESSMPKTEKNALAVASGDMGSVYQQAKTEGDRLDFYRRLPQILATMDQAEAKKQNASALLSAEDQSQWADLMDSDAGWAWYESLSGKTAQERQQSAQAFAQKLLGEQPASSNAQSYLNRPKDSADVAWLKDYIRRNTSKGAQAWLEEATGTADEQAARDALYFAQYDEKEQAMQQSPDYLEKSRADAQYASNPRYSYINNLNGTREKMSGAIDQGVAAGYGLYRFMSDDQIANYNYLYATEGKAAADEYLNDYVTYSLNQQAAEYSNTQMEEMGQQGTGGAVLASALSVPFSQAGGVGVLDVAGQHLRNLVSGKYRPIDYNTGLSQMGALSSSARKGVQQQVDWNVNLLGHNLDVFDLLYGGAMSSIDSIVGAQMGSVLNTIRYTSSAAQDAALSAKEAGANDGQILGIMAAAGFSEWLGEAIPFDKFFKMAGSTDQQTLSRVIRNALEEGFTNAPGEMVTEFSNALAQHLILGDKSDAAQEYQQYLDMGLDEKEAWKRTAIDLGWQIGEAGLGGFLQGAGMGGAASLQSAQASRRMDFTAGERILTAKTGENLKALAMSLGEDTEVGQLGNQYNPETATARETGKLFRQIMNALPGEQNKGTVQDSVALDLASTLDAMGETGNLFSIANSILDVYQGYDLSEGQRLELAASAHGLEVLNALTAREAASNSAQAAAKSAMAAEAEARRTGAQADREAAEKAREAERQARAIRDGQYMQQATQARQDTQQTPAAATADEGAAWLDAEPSVAEGAQTAPEVNQTTAEAAQTATETAQEAPAAAPAAAEGEAKAPAPNARQTAQEEETEQPEKQTAKKAPPEKPILSQAVRENGERQESIRQIRESENGVEAVTESGRAVPVDELQVSDSQKTLLENSVGMDSRAAAEMVQDFREGGDQDAQDYSIGFQRIYNAAKNGRTMEQIQTMFGELLTPEQRQKAFDQGRQAADRLKAEAAEKRAADGKTNARLAQAYDFRTAAEAKGQSGLYFANVTRKLSSNVALTQLKLIDQFAKEYGLQVRVFDTLEKGKANGMLEKGTNIINLALDAQEGALTRTVSHEAYHYIAQQSREQAEKLQNFVRERLEGQEGYDLLARIQEKQEQYRQNGVKLTADEAMEEITADSVLDVIGTEKNLQALVKQDKTMAQRLGQVLRQMAERLKAIIQRFGRQSPEVQALSEDADYVEKIAGMMEDALLAVRDNYRMATEGAFTAAKQDAAVQQYISDMSTAATDEDAQTAMNGLVSSLFARSQQKYMAANPYIDLSKEVARFADALKAFGEGNVSMVQAALTRAGFDSPAAGDSLIAPLAYAGKKLAGMDERGMSTDVKYSLKTNENDFDKSFAQQVDEWMEGQFGKDDSLVLGPTPELYQQIGLSALPIVIDQEHVKYAVNGGKGANHRMGAAMLKQLPGLLRNPVAVIESGSRPGDSVVAIVSAKVNGNQMMAAVEVGGIAKMNGKRYDANVLSSAYGRENAITKLLTEAIQKENAGETGVYFLKKSEARSLFDGSGVQFPGSAIQDGLIHSIFDAGAKVNREFKEQTETRQFKRWFGNSKVVDENGKPMVVYHGTRAENGNFHVFDYDQAKKKGGLGLQTLGKGNYFTSNELTGQERYGSRVIPAYLSIQNPFMMEAGMNFRDEVSKRMNVNAEKLTGQAIQDAMRENGYDGVMQRNSDGSIIAVTFDSNQIKSATENMGTFDASNPDIRYSLKETDIAEQVAQDPVLQSQLQSDRSIRALAEMMDKLHKTVLRGDSFLQEGATEPALKAGEWAKRTGAIADKLIQETGTKMSKQTIARRLHTLYNAMDNIDMDAGEALMFARSAARQMLEKSPGVLAEQDDTTKAVVQAAKNNAFYLTADMKSEIRGTYGSVQNYLRKNFGRMKIRSKSGTTISLSEFWRETLNPLSPGTFSLDVTEADMPGILDAFLENAGQKRYSEAYGANLDQYATDLALGVMLEYYDVPGGIGKAEGLRKAFIKAREELRQSYAQRYQQRLTSQAERRQENQQRQSLRGQIERDSKYLAVRVNQPTDNRHVPEGLQGVAGALSQAIRAGERFDEKALLTLKAQYSLIGEEGSEYDAGGAYDEDILYTIGELAKTLPGKKMTELTTQELQDLANVAGNLKKMISEANEIFINGRKTTLDAAGEEVISQLAEKKDVRREKLKALAYKNTTPTYFFDTLGGQLKRCYDGMLEGQNQYAFNMRRAKEHMDGLIDKYHVNDWIHDKNHLKFETIQGKQVELNRDQALALYALWNRETRNKRQNASHLRIGGFMYRSSVDYKGVEKTRPHRITEADMRTVMNWLTQEQMDFADAAVRYLSTTMADLGNETSMALYGYKKYTEAYYFPYASSKDFIQQDLTKSDDSGTRQPKNMGMSKATVRKANNPIFLDGFMETWAGHVNQMCVYNGFSQPVDTINRIFNYKTAGTDDAYGLSVKAELKRVYGQAAVTYLSNLARDVSGGVVAQERTGVNKWLSKFKKNAVAANLSVVIQQPSAIMRAMNMVSPKYFIKPANALKEAAEMEKYSGVALIKSMGRFDTGTGFTGEEWLTGSLKAETKLKQASAKMDEVTGFGAEQADRITWGTMWAAIKREISATTQLQEGTQEYFDAVARRFNDVMNHTQVYDSILVKSDIMRGKSTMDKMVTAFMAEPTVSYNMLQFAIQNLGKKDANGRNIGRKAAMRAVAAFAANTLFNAMLKSLVSMGRRWGEEDRTILEKYLAELSENFTGDMNPLSMVPVARDIVSIWQGYDVERSDMSVVTDLKDAYDEVMNDENSFGEKMIAVAGALGNLLGIPAKNVIRDFQGALNILGSAPIGETSGRDIKYGVLEGLSFLGMDLYDGGTGTYYERALDALEKGDEKTYEELRGYLTETRLKEESTVKSGIRYRMEDRAKAGSMTWDEYFTLWRDRLGGKSSNIRGKISTLYKDGRIDEGEAKALLRKYGEYKDENDIYYAIEKWNWQQENPDAEDDYSRYGKVYDAVKAGKDASAAIREMTQHGYTEAKVKSQIADKIGSWYIGGEMTRAAAETALKRYTDKTDGDDIWFQLRRWDYQKNHNGSGEGYSAYGDFFKAVETGTNLPSRIKELTDHGVSASTLAGKITSQYKQQYIQLYAKDKTKAAALKARLLTAYAALGYDRTKKNKDIEKWLKQDTKKK